MRRSIAHLNAALADLYGLDAAAAISESVASQAHRSSAPAVIDRNDLVLTAYPDHVSSPGQPTLKTLWAFLDQALPPGLQTTIHVLPPYVSDGDDGFAVVDHSRIAERFGTWSDVRPPPHRNLMLDFVLNHVAATHQLFQEFLEGGDGSELFHVFDSSMDLRWGSSVRDHDLLQPFDVCGVKSWVWCTYGRGQIDLNYSSPATFLHSVQTLFTLATTGASVIRLDALPHSWKEVGGSPNMPQVHQLVAAWRATLDLLGSSTQLLAEADTGERYVRHGGASYANVLAFPSLVLAAVLLREARPLVDWIEGPGSAAPLEQVTFLSTHDGVHLMPMKPPLPGHMTTALVQSLEQREGTLVRFSQGRTRAAPYEVNGALASIYGRGESVDDYVLAHAILLCSPGRPQIYLPDLFGLSSIRARSGHPRSAIRGRWRLDDLRETIRVKAHFTIVNAISRIALARQTAISAKGSTFRAREHGPGVFELQVGEPAGLVLLVNRSTAPATFRLSLDKPVSVGTGSKVGNSVSLGPMSYMLCTEARLAMTTPSNPPTSV